MRDLILVRGAPGSGKSTWIKENHLEPYTISSDAVRLMFSCPEDDPKTGIPHVCQRYENAVWDFIESTIELRMRMGQFIVLDAQNIKPQRWAKLAEKYRYRVYVKQIEATLEECLERNAKRPILQRVPEHAIMASFWKIGNSQLSNRFQPVTASLVAGNLEPTSVFQYERVWICGDVHGCYEPLKAFYDKTGGFPETDLIIFVGDYVDRGIQNRETLELLCSQRHKMNVIFLEGNHHWEVLWSQDRTDEIKSHEFMNNTLPQIENMDKKVIREWASRWSQLFYFRYNCNLYLVTHAGIGYMPEHLLYVPAQTFIRGGAYEDDVDKWWCEKDYGKHLIQVHGHRNFYCYDMDEPLLAGTSINLNSTVEFGEPLRVMCIHHNGPTEYLQFENPVHRTGLIKFRKAEILEGKTQATPEELTQILVDNLRHSKGINEKQLSNNISSFNFSRDVFHKNEWDDIKLIARGLFIDTYAWRILARGYVKFFNFAEREKNTKKYLQEHLVFPCTAYRKYNGFLGIVSWDWTNDRLFIASKSTNEGDHSQLAEKILRKYAPIEAITKYLKENNCTMLFEICTLEDPHIIKEEEGPVLLDIVENTINFHKKPYEEVKAFAEANGLRYKQLDAVINTFAELEPMLDTMWVMDPGHPVEGWCIEDATGYMFKLKTYYYKKWKRLRTIKELIQTGTVNINEALFADGGLMHSLVDTMLSMNRMGTLNTGSIIDFREMWLSFGDPDFDYKPSENSNES